MSVSPSNELAFYWFASDIVQSLHWDSNQTLVTEGIASATCFPFTPDPRDVIVETKQKKTISDLNFDLISVHLSIVSAALPPFTVGQIRQIKSQSILLMIVFT